MKTKIKKRDFKSKRKEYLEVRKEIIESQLRRAGLKEIMDNTKENKWDMNKQYKQ